MKNILVLMAGEGTRFNGDKPKPFVSYKDIPLFHYSTKCFDRMDPSNRFIFVVQKKHLNSYNLIKFLSNNYANYEIVIQDGKKNGPAHSSLEAEYILKENYGKFISDSGLFILDCDSYNEFIPEEILFEVEKNSLSGAILSFESDNDQNSFIKTNKDNIILEIKEKNKISNCASAGVYYWKSISEYFNFCKKTIADKINCKEVYISDVYAKAIDNGHKFLNYSSKKTISVGTKKDYYSFINNEFYNSYNRSLHLMSKWDTEYMCDNIDILKIENKNFITIDNLNIISKKESKEIKKFYGLTYIYVYDTNFYHSIYDNLNEYHILKKFFPDINIVFLTLDNLSYNNLFNKECLHNHNKRIPRICEIKDTKNFTNSAYTYIKSMNLIESSSFFMESIHKEYDPSMSIYGIPNENIYFEKIIFANDRENFISSEMFEKFFPIEIKELINYEYNEYKFLEQKSLINFWSNKIIKKNTKNKIFITRNKNNKMIEKAKEPNLEHRYTHKHEAILLDFFKSIGFEECDFEGKSFKEQVEICINADFIAGFSGSGIANAVFAVDDIKVLEIYNINWLTPYKRLFSSFPNITYNRIDMYDFDISSSKYLEEFKKNFYLHFKEYNEK